LALIILGFAWDVIEHHCCTCYPNEACGVMLGGSDDADYSAFVDTAVPVPNVAADPRANYRIDPQELLGVEQRAATLGRKIIGLYHSHPDLTVTFSPDDFRDAYGRWRYLVLSIRGGEFADVAVWVPKSAGVAAAEELHVIEVPGEN